MITALAEGWADAGLARMSGATCEDPLTGLVSFAYLRTRLREVYREAEQQGTCPPATHRLVVVELPRRPDPWRRISLVILVGHDLRAAFPGGDTLSLDRPGPAIALVQVTERACLPLHQPAPHHPGRPRHGGSHDQAAGPAGGRRASPGRAGPLTPPALASRGGDGTRRRRPARAAGLAEGTRPAANGAGRLGRQRGAPAGGGG